MPWRKWLVRGLVYSVFTGGALTFLLYHFWTSPTTVRRLVLAKINERFPGATATLDAAHLRILGGIAVGELRMARRDDLDHTDFVYVPSAVIYHDKEQLLDGILALRKIEVFRPRLRVVRQRDGRLNIAGVTAPPRDPREPLPTLVVQQGTIVIEDQGAAPGVPLLEIKDVSLTAVNDPLPYVQIEGAGNANVLGPVRITGRLRRDSGEADLNLEMTAIPIGTPLVQRLAALCPEAAAQLRQFQGEGEIHAALTYRPGCCPALAFDADVRLHKGSLSHPRLPLAIADLEAELRIVSTPNLCCAPPDAAGSPAHPAAPVDLVRLPTAHITGRSGAMHLDLLLKDVSVPCPLTEGDGEVHLDHMSRELDWKFEHLPVTSKLLDSFPALKEIQHDYQPSGPVTVTHHLRRDAAGGWHKTWHIEPEGMTAEFVKFRYPVENITGEIDHEKFSDQRQASRIRLRATASGQPITVTGTTFENGDGPAAIDVAVRGDNIPLDAKLGLALQGPARTEFNQFHPAGRGDFDVRIMRDQGSTQFHNRFLVHVHDAALNYDLFRYRLHEVSGVLDILPDHWEARGFRAKHGTGEMRFSGQSFPPAPGGKPTPLMRIEIQGTGIDLNDSEFEAALAPPEMPARAPLRTVYHELGLSGRMNFTAEVTDIYGGDPANLDVKVTAHGFSALPQFFKYRFDDASGTVHYSRDGVRFDDLSARHGPALFRIRTGQAIAKPGCAFQTRIGIPEKPGTGLTATGLTADADLLRALPEQLRGGLDAVKLRGPFDVVAEMVVDPQTDGKTDVWWDGNLYVRNAAFQAGIDVTGVQGQVSCCGMCKNQKLTSAVGTAWFPEASILGQPFHNMHTRFVVDRDTPQLLRFYDVGAELFGGQVGGQAHIDFTGSPNFELNLIGLQLRLEQFGQFNAVGQGAELEGMAEVSLFLKGNVDDENSLAGDGRLDVPKGKLYRLPPLLDLFKALGLHAPDRTAFERARLEFNVEGQQVKVKTLNLFGSFMSLRGQGTVNVDGSDLNLEVNADPGMLPAEVPVFSWMQQTVSDQLLRINVRGSLTEPKFEKVLVPVVVDPVRRLLGTSR